MPEKLPPPLPPETRTVGQLVAESIRLYGDRFWLALPLGLPLAVIDQLGLGHSRKAQIGLLWVAAPFLTACYAAASAIVARTRPRARAWLLALVAGVIVFLPATLFLGWFALLAVVWLALTGFVVPVAVLEHRGFLATFRRARELALVDFLHAVGSLATLAIVFFLSRLVLIQLLQGQGDTTIRVAAALADLVVSPLLFLGAALLYFDQAARVSSGGRAKRRSDADVRSAVESDVPGRPDAEVES